MKIIEIELEKTLFPQEVQKIFEENIRLITPTYFLYDGEIHFILYDEQEDMLGEICSSLFKKNCVRSMKIRDVTPQEAT